MAQAFRKKKGQARLEYREWKLARTWPASWARTEGQGPARYVLIKKDVDIIHNTYDGFRVYSIIRKARIYPLVTGKEPRNIHKNFIIFFLFINKRKINRLIQTVCKIKLYIIFENIFELFILEKLVRYLKFFGNFLYLWIVSSVRKETRSFEVILSFSIITNLNRFNPDLVLSD